VGKHTHTHNVGAFEEQKTFVNRLYYVNIRFIANVQLYPNTIVNNFFEDTLQQQYHYLYKNTYTLATNKSSPCEVVYTWSWFARLQL